MKQQEIEEIKKKRVQIKEQQQHTQLLMSEIEMQIKNCYILYKKEQKLNDQLLHHFHGLSEHYVIDNMTDDMRNERRQLFDCLDEVHDILIREQCNLTTISDYLFEEERKILGEKEERDGNNK